MRRRADLVLVERSLAPSRQKARALIQDGAVTCNGQPIQKPGQLVRPDADFHVDKLFALGQSWRIKVGTRVRKIQPPTLSEEFA